MLDRLEEPLRNVKHREALLAADLSTAPAPMPQAKLVSTARFGLRALLRAEPLWDLLALIRER